MAEEVEVTFNPLRPPLPCLAAGHAVGARLRVRHDKHIDMHSPQASSSSSAESDCSFEGDELALRLASRSGPNPSALALTSPCAATHADQWLLRAFHRCFFEPGKHLPDALHSLGDFLAMRSYLVADSLSLADCAVWGCLKRNKQAEKLRSEDADAGSNAPSSRCHVWRWMDFLEQGHTCFANALQDVKNVQKSFASQRREESEKPADVELPNAEHGHVVTRFPPEPSGFLHIGHCKAALLNDHFARKYGGRMILRFDDTNPEKEGSEFEENIVRDVHDMGVSWSEVTHTSDYFQQMLELGREMCTSGYVFVDDTPVEQMRHERLNCQPSQRRTQSPEEAERLFSQEMMKGTDVGKRCCARLKMDHASDNGALRDPVAFRCYDASHPRTGTSFKCFPTYDFACPYVDAIEGVTHALRTSEYKDRDEQYHWAQKLMGVRHVHLWDYSRLNFVHTTLSKRKLQWFVDQNVVDGWSDPRFPTVQGIRRRGLTAKALRDFIVSQGASRNNTMMAWDKIWTVNKQIIDKVCPRYTAVATQRAVPGKISNFPFDGASTTTSTEVVALPKHKKHPPAGEKVGVRASDILLDSLDVVELNEGEEVTLMDWGNAIIRKICYTQGAESGGLRRHDRIEQVTLELHLQGDYKKTKWKLHWLADIDQLVPLQLEYFGHLLTKKALEEEDSLEDFVNTESKRTEHAVGDVNLRHARKGDILQLERMGYFKVDRQMLRESERIVLLNVPDGKNV
jgi:glutamyl-tRNA synthetase